MEPWKKYKIPTASKLFWMIPHEEETSEQEVDISKPKINLKYSFLSYQQFKIVEPSIDMMIILLLKVVKEYVDKIRLLN